MRIATKAANKKSPPMECGGLTPLSSARGGVATGFSWALPQFLVDRPRWFGVPTLLTEEEGSGLLRIGGRFWFRVIRVFRGQTSWGPGDTPWSPFFLPTPGVCCGLGRTDTRDFEMGSTGVSPYPPTDGARRRPAQRVTNTAINPHRTRSSTTRKTMNRFRAIRRSYRSGRMPWRLPAASRSTSLG